MTNTDPRASRLAGGAALALLMAACLTPAAAQTPGNGLATNYNANAGKPIDIEADGLEVDDKKKIAVFKGNVSATQGDFNLKAKEIQVLYAATKKEPGKDGALSTASTNSVLPGGGGADITQIDAKGKVLITTKDDQTATSEWAVFEVKKQLVTLGGDVVISRGPNTLKGNKVVIDLVSGQTRFENAGKNTTTASGDQPNDRIRMIFTPKSRTEAAKPDAAKPAKPN